jgi:hypothetical protein
MDLETPEVGFISQGFKDLSLQLILQVDIPLSTVGELDTD